jgi:hypothetical protein
MTEATLSDRDGYLVGVPVELGSETITNQFTEAGGLDLGITRAANSTDIILDWPGQSTESVTSYTIHRSEVPYFTPDSSTVIATLPNTGQGLASYIDSGVLGNDINSDEDPYPYFYNYTLGIQCASGLQSPPSWWVGKFEYMMYELSLDTDLTWVGLVLDTEESLTNASDLVDHIEANSNGAVTVTTLSEWTGGQNYNLYRPSNPTGTYDFPLSLGKPYRIEIDITGLNSGNIIWAQVGKLPPVEIFSYSLYELSLDMDFTWVLIPLNLNDITFASVLANHVMINSTPAVGVTTIVEWSGSSQNNTLYRYSGGTGSVDFPTRFGYPYRLEISADAIWP